MDRRGTIGKGNALPWHLPGELAYFKATTLGKSVVMGRLTHESIGRPLPGRRNIVVSRQTGYLADGCEVVNELSTGLRLCASDEEVMVIGGAQIYAEALPLAQRLYVTRIHACFDGDRFFPEFDERQWSLTRETPGHDGSDGIPAFDYQVLERR